MLFVTKKSQCKLQNINRPLSQKNVYIIRDRLIQQGEKIKSLTERGQPVIKVWILAFPYKSSPNYLKIFFRV